MRAGDDLEALWPWLVREIEDGGLTLASVIMAEIERLDDNDPRRAELEARRRTISSSDVFLGDRL